MKEKDLNTIIVRSLKDIGFAFKISDPIGGQKSQTNPFDGFAVYKNYNIYFESKILKPLKSFNFNSIEIHQEKFLNQIKDENSDNFCIYTIGVFEQRKYFYLFVFDSELIRYLKSLNRNSILKKEFTCLIEKGKLLNMKRVNSKYQFDANLIFEKVVGVKEWKEIFDA